MDRRQFHYWYATGLALTAIAAGHAVAQETPRRLPDGEGCRSCTIDLEHVAALGDDSPEGFVGSTLHVTRAGDRYYVAVREVPSEIRVFDRLGVYVRTIGRLGEGPGEYKDIAALWAAPGDSLYVYDRGTGRLTVLDPQHTVVRTTVLPISVHPKGIVVLADRMVVNGYDLSERRVGLLLHTLDPQGRVVESFGGQDDASGPDRTFGPGGIRWLASAGRRSEFWTARFREYVIERWSVEGRLIARFDRSPTWFVTRRAPRSDPKPPEPQLLDIYEAPDGLVWVLGRVADPKWEENVVAVKGGRRIVDRELHRDLVIEVIDPSVGEVLASRTFPHFGIGFLPGGELVTYRESDDGVPRLEVWRIHLTLGRTER